MSAPTYKWQISNLENAPWTRYWDASVNPGKATAFEVQPFSDHISVMCAGPAYSGYLAKCVSTLPLQSPSITYSYSIWFDESIACGQVAETDTKITDDAGWTYDGSFQWNVAKGWIGQINNPWVDTTAKATFKPDAWNPVSIQYALDYAAHTLTVKSVNGQALSLPPIPAKQIGWGKREIVTQKQLCIAGQEGAYTLRFSQIGYSGQ